MFDFTSPTCFRSRSRHTTRRLSPPPPPPATIPFMSSCSSSPVMALTDLLGIAFNAVLYSRDVYPAVAFAEVRKYGDLRVMVATAEPVRQYLGKVLSHIAEWLARGLVRRLVLVVSDASTLAPVERWTFAVSERIANDTGPITASVEVDEARALLRQLQECHTFMPPVSAYGGSDGVTFEILVHSDTSCNVPTSWQLSDARAVLPRSPAPTAGSRGVPASFRQVTPRPSFLAESSSAGTGVADVALRVIRCGGFTLSTTVSYIDVTESVVAPTVATLRPPGLQTSRR